MRAPEIELVAKQLAAETVALPGGEIAILQRQLRQLRIASLESSRVQLADLVVEDLDCPRVESHVVRREQDHVRLGAEPEQRSAQH